MDESDHGPRGASSAAGSGLAASLSFADIIRTACRQLLEDKECAVRGSCRSHSCLVWRLKFAEFAKPQPVLLTSGYRIGAGKMILSFTSWGKGRKRFKWARRKLGCRESPEEKECRNGSDECLGQPGDSADALCLCLHQRREPEGIY